jgi:hypothetical protein
MDGRCDFMTEKVRHLSFRDQGDTCAIATPAGMRISATFDLRALPAKLTPTGGENIINYLASGCDYT